MSRIAILEGYDAAPSSFRGRYGEPERSAVEKCLIRCYEQRAEGGTVAAKKKTRKTKSRRSAAQKAASAKAAKRLKRALRACKGKTGEARGRCMSKNMKK